MIFSFICHLQCLYALARCGPSLFIPRLVEGRLNHLRPDRFVADQHVELSANLGELRANERQSQVLADARSGHTACHFAGLLALRRDHPVPRACNATADHLEAHEPATRTGSFDLLQRLVADKRTFVQLDNPAKTRLVGVDRLADLVTIQRKLGLEAQAVTRSKANRLEPVGTADL